MVATGWKLTHPVSGIFMANSFYPWETVISNPEKLTNELCKSGIVIGQPSHATMQLVNTTTLFCTVFNQGGELM